MASPNNQLPDFDELWNYERPAETEQAFRAVLEQIDGRETPPAYRLELLTQIARTRGLQRRFELAHATLDQVETELHKMSPAAPERATPCIRYLLERGRVFNSAGQSELARPLFLQAWESATASMQDAYAVDAAHMLGIVELGEEGLEWNRKALALSQSSHDPRARSWQGSLYNNIGWTYHSAGEYKEALTMFERAQSAWQSDGQLDLVPVARWSVARTLRSLGRVDEALARQMALKEEFDASNTSDGYVSEEIGECLLLLGREEESRPYFARAWSVLSQNIWLSANEPERLERLHSLGMVGKGR
jgi:tetratricopeptide (TPR) repeat protein